jgi:hypothetical protein
MVGLASSIATFPAWSSDCLTPPAGLVGWWPGESNANDIAGTNNGTLIGGGSFVSGEVGQAFSFNGASQCVQIPYAPSLASSNYSVEAWVKPLAQVSDPISQDVIFGQSYGQCQLAARTGSTGISIAFQFGVSPVTFYGVVSTYEIPLGQFTHLAGTWDGSTLRLYINGVLNAQSTPGASPVDSGCPFSIGGFYNSCGYVGQFFNGLIDEVSYYNRALSGGEVQAIYNAGSAGKCEVPFITSQPQGQTATSGSTVTFVVTAGGSPPLGYQWQFNTTNIPGATASSLTLTNVQPGQAGNYLVVVSNAWGSATSSNAVLAVLPAPCATPPAGLVAWWPGEGNANDIAGTNNGTLSGGASFVSGEVGQAFSFDGTSGTVTVPDSSSLRLTTAFTIEAWINPHLENSDQAIVSKVGIATGNNGYQLYLSHQNMLTGQFNSPGQLWPGNVIAYTNSSAIAPGAWFHVAWIYDQSAMKLYLNGLPVATNVIGPRAIAVSSTDLRISGADNHVYFYGLIDEPSVYTRALSDGEIAAIYNAGSAGKCKPAPTPQAATATATVLNGFVVGANLSYGGRGYTNTPIVRIFGGGGSGAQAVAVVSNGVVIAVNVMDAGSGYTNTPVIAIAPPFIAPPAAAIGAASLLSFTNLLVGTDYQLQFFRGNTWSNLGAAFTAAGSSFAQYVPGTAGPNGYRLASTPVPTQAYATAQVFNGFVVGATVTSGGSGYGSTVIVSVVGGGGSNATAIATVSGGVVTGLSITDAGIGYTSTPSIIIAPPPANAQWPMVTQAVELDLGSLSPYENYQLEFAPVLGGSWSNLGGLFTPTATTNTQYINASGNAGFFRVRYVP